MGTASSPPPLRRRSRDDLRPLLRAQLRARAVPSSRAKRLTLVRRKGKAVPLQNGPPMPSISPSRRLLLRATILGAIAASALPRLAKAQAANPEMIAPVQRLNTGLLAIMKSQ